MERGRASLVPPFKSDPILSEASVSMRLICTSLRTLPSFSTHDGMCCQHFEHTHVRAHTQRNTQAHTHVCSSVSIKRKKDLENKRAE